MTGSCRRWPPRSARHRNRRRTRRSSGTGSAGRCGRSTGGGDGADARRCWVRVLPEALTSLGHRFLVGLQPGVQGTDLGRPGRRRSVCGPARPHRTGRTVRSNAAQLPRTARWVRRRPATPGTGHAAGSPPGPGPATGCRAARPAGQAHPRSPRPPTAGHHPATPPRTRPRRRRSGRSSGRRRGRAAGPGRSRSSARRRPVPRGPATRTPGAGPAPRAFSIAQRRSGHRPAQVSSRRYSRSVASIRIEATSRFDSGSTAVAVDVDLCGSTPISIIVIGSLHFPWNWMGGSAVDTPTSRALAGAFVVTPLLSQAANGHRAGSTHPTRANPRRRQEFRESARPVSYGDATSDQPGRRLRSLHAVKQSCRSDHNAPTATPDRRQDNHSLSSRPPQKARQPWFENAASNAADGGSKASDCTKASASGAPTSRSIPASSHSTDIGPE